MPIDGGTYPDYPDYPDILLFTWRGNMYGARLSNLPYEVPKEIVPLPSDSGLFLTTFGNPWTARS